MGFCVNRKSLGGFAAIWTGRTYDEGVVNRADRVFTNSSTSCNDGRAKSPRSEKQRQEPKPRVSANRTFSFGTHSMRMPSFWPSASIMHWSTMCFGRMLAEIMRTSTVPLCRARKLAFRPTIEIGLFHSDLVEPPASAGIWTADNLATSCRASSSVIIGLEIVLFNNSIITSKMLLTNIVQRAVLEHFSASLSVVFSLPKATGASAYRSSLVFDSWRFISLFY